jgi:hypothetical protein
MNNSLYILAVTAIASSVPVDMQLELDLHAASLLVQLLQPCLCSSTHGRIHSVSCPCSVSICVYDTTLLYT